jgi:hypothetical protein
MKTFIQTHAEYEFYAPEIFAGYDALAKLYESEWFAYLSKLRDAYAIDGDIDDVPRQSETALAGFMTALRGE